MDYLFPKGITGNKAKREVAIQWSDDHISNYTYSILRYACPCVECRGGHDNMSNVPPEEVFYMPIEDNPATRIERIENVGGYGITIEWEDGHHFGIYNWHYLRALCPCTICREMMIYGQ